MKKNDIKLFRKQDPDSGFTLVEVLVSLIILSFIVVSAFQSVSISAKSISIANRNSQIQNILSEIVTKNYTNVETPYYAQGTTASGYNWTYARQKSHMENLDTVNITIANEIDNSLPFEIETIMSSSVR